MLYHHSHSRDSEIKESHYSSLNFFSLAFLTNNLCGNPIYRTYWWKQNVTTLENDGFCSCNSREFLFLYFVAWI